jgi:hypothetical protein
MTTTVVAVVAERVTDMLLAADAKASWSGRELSLSDVAEASASFYIPTVRIDGTEAFTDAIEVLGARLRGTDPELGAAVLRDVQSALTAVAREAIDGAGAEMGALLVILTVLLAHISELESKSFAVTVTDLLGEFVPTERQATDG